MVQVGTWLLPEAYGNDYDHFTMTRMESKPGVCIAVFARVEDLMGTPYEWVVTQNQQGAPSDERGPSRPASCIPESPS